MRGGRSRAGFHGWAWRVRKGSAVGEGLYGAFRIEREARGLGVTESDYVGCSARCWWWRNRTIMGPDSQIIEDS